MKDETGETVGIADGSYRDEYGVRPYNGSPRQQKEYAALLAAAKAVLAAYPGGAQVGATADQIVAMASLESAVEEAEK